MHNINIFRLMERFAALPRRADVPFDPFITAESQGGYRAALKLSYYRRRSLLTRGFKRPGLHSKPNLLGRFFKLFCASKPSVDPSWIWRFSDFNCCLSVLKYWDGEVVKRKHIGEGWYLRMNVLWGTAWPFKPQNRLTK
jgi:hypothetical protein